MAYLGFTEGVLVAYVYVTNPDDPQPAVLTYYIATQDV